MHNIYKTRVLEEDIIRKLLEVIPETTALHILSVIQEKKILYIILDREAEKNKSLWIQHLLPEHPEMFFMQREHPF